MSNYLVPIVNLPYDPNNLESVVGYAKKLLNKSLRYSLTAEEVRYAESKVGKGDFGNLLESCYFKVRINSESRPDIIESGIEIKSGQVKVIRNSKDVIKERLKISMINYMNDFQAKSLEEALLWSKLEKILLLLFRKDSNSLRIDETCVYSDLLLWSSDDIKQMSEDWLHIKQMVTSGNANDLSEGHTWYLGACTAGANSTTSREAPGWIKAKVRAFSLKSSYLNYKLGYSVKISTPKVLLKPNAGESLDSFILSNMGHFFNKPIDQISSLIGRPEMSQSFAKNMRSRVGRAILEEVAGRQTSNVTTVFEQFSKAGVIEKTITLESNGRLRESVSFPAFKWKELNEEVEWESSELYAILTTKFFFTVFKKTSSTMPILVGCFFWTMPRIDLDLMKALWIDTKQKIKDNNYGDFIKLSQHEVGHVRPHARDASDTYPTPNNGAQTKKSFWLNNDYIQDVAAKALRL